MILTLNHYIPLLLLLPGGLVVVVVIIFVGGFYIIQTKVFKWNCRVYMTYKWSKKNRHCSYAARKVNKRFAFRRLKVEPTEVLLTQKTQNTSYCCFVCGAVSFVISAVFPSHTQDIHILHAQNVNFVIASLLVSFFMMTW